MYDTGVKTATKSRILFLLKYLQQNTDDEHELTTEELISILAENEKRCLTVRPCRTL